MLSAITNGGFIAAVLGASDIEAVVGTVISGILLAINAYLKDHDMGELVRQHEQVVATLRLISEMYLSLSTSLRLGRYLAKEVQPERDTALEEMKSAYSVSPCPISAAEIDAQRALQKLGDKTLSDAEPDADAEGALFCTVT